MRMRLCRSLPLVYEDWKNRNEVVFNGVHQQPLEVLESWRRNIYEFRDATLSATEGDHPRCRPMTSSLDCGGCRWEKPAYGVLKVNTNALWCKSTLRTGVGWVYHDFAGLLHGAGGSGSEMCHSAAAGEACAIKTTLMAYIDYGLIMLMMSVSFSSVPRESNLAAHSIANFVFKEGRDFGWDCIGPEFLFNILAQDVNLSIRI
ncbi:unnamed protein product [Malus baccata var. baccata]